MTNDENFLDSSIKLFRYYRKLGEGAIAQLSDADINVRPNEASNSIVPKGNSDAFNKEKFDQEKSRKHFTDGLK